MTCRVPLQGVRIMMNTARVNNERIRHLLKLIQFRKNLTNLGKTKN